MQKMTRFLEYKADQITEIENPIKHNKKLHQNHTCASMC